LGRTRALGVTGEVEPYSSRKRRLSAILIRDEYGSTFETLRKYPAKSGGMVVTGGSGIGTNLLQKGISTFANGLPTCREIGLYTIKPDA